MKPFLNLLGGSVLPCVGVAGMTFGRVKAD